MIDLRERLEETCKLAQDNVRKLDIKQNAFYDKRARSRKFDVGDKVFCYSRVRAIKYYFNGTAHRSFGSSQCDELQD